jgi:ubiquinone/menaquinone biosynthesis C-methylase UbiE
MDDLKSQIDYWNRLGPTKPFSHPVNVSRLAELVDLDCRILDFGCGCGRVMGLLHEHGYRNLVGVDPAPRMIAAARQRFPALTFLEANSTRLPLADESVDAALLFTVLTCIPSDDEQRRVIREIGRVLRPDGLLYISDLWLQKDERNVDRYRRYQAKYGVYGIFELPEGVVLRHHTRQWIEQLTAQFTVIAVDEIVAETMNGHRAEAFQWFGRKAGPA